MNYVTILIVRCTHGFIATSICLIDVKNKYTGTLKIRFYLESIFLSIYENKCRTLRYLSRIKLKNALKRCYDSNKIILYIQNKYSTQSMKNFTCRLFWNSFNLRVRAYLILSLQILLIKYIVQLLISK